MLTLPVLGAQSRQFKTVFGEAQTQLRITFGMEMTELPLKDKVTLAQKRGEQRTLALMSREVLTFSSRTEVAECPKE